MTDPSSAKARLFRFVHVGFHFAGENPPIDALEKVFDSAKDWYRYDHNCWILYTNTNLDTWRDRIRATPGISDDDSFFLAEFSEYSGYQKKAGWAFIERNSSSEES